MKITLTDTSGALQKQILIPDLPGPNGNPVENLFAFSRLSVATIRSSVESGEWPPFTVGWGELSLVDLQTVRDIYVRATERFPVKIESPFEGSEFIAGGVWKDNEADDAVVPLQFAAGCDDLPPHIHRFSDRLIVILNGCGRMHFSHSAAERFSKDDFEFREITNGSLMVFCGERCTRSQLRTLIWKCCRTTTRLSRLTIQNNMRW